MAVWLWGTSMTAHPGAPDAAEGPKPRAYFTSSPCPQCQSDNDGLAGRFACDICGTVYDLPTPPE
ncbi:hypothetical protein DMH18_17505 [Streptomyces sp. WAC 06783]|uniref:hypothetical protein n=1 Tax=Streptomyces sp. WAC 06783 TaxID=2203211 RepID=UPI000F7496DA|nr:hypothetical protein [Streptomyces sp. WAC 06783]RSO09243.1 hypothetical protein DMH18_17505 [Streptomyces sp. WAC 06783]